MVSFALALVAIVGAGGGHVLQLVPVETVLILRVEAQCILMLVVGGVIVPQLIHDIEQKLPVSDHRCSRVRRQNMLRGHFADRDVLLVAGVVTAGEACFFKRGIQQRVRAGQQVLTGGINGADEEVDRCGSPLGRQGDVLLNSSGEVILFIAQIPAVEGIARAGRVVRLGRGEAVFHFLLGRNGRAAVRVEGDGILVDLPLRRQGDVLCDGGIKVIRGGGLLVFAQIPAGKGEALERRVCRFLCIQTVFDHLRVNLAAAVGIEGDFELVDLPLRRQGDVLCDGGIKVIRGGGLLVFAQIPERKGEALERRVGRRDSLLAALDVLLIGRRRTAVSVEGNGIFLRHMHEALRHDPPAAPVQDQRDRNDLLIVLDMFQVRERLVELGHIEVWDIVDVAKPVVPDLLRLADEVVFIVLAEQAVGVLMLLQFIYVALDLNSHFKLFQLVSRGRVGGVLLPDGVEGDHVRARADSQLFTGLEVFYLIVRPVTILIRRRIPAEELVARAGRERFVVDREGIEAIGLHRDVFGHILDLTVVCARVCVIEQRLGLALDIDRGAVLCILLPLAGRFVIREGSCQLAVLLRGAQIMAHAQIGICKIARRVEVQRIAVVLAVPCGLERSSAVKNRDSVRRVVFALDAKLQAVQRNVLLEVGLRNHVRVNFGRRMRELYLHRIARFPSPLVRIPRIGNASGVVPQCVVR